MESWVVYAILSTLTGGAALVFSKMGMQQANHHVALFIRTGILFAIIAINAICSGGLKNMGQLTTKTYGWFALAGISTAIYWICFFKAIRTANVSVVSTIDKGSILVTFLLSYLLLNEPITPKLLFGAALILAGTVILIR